jgi:hypothetical protein
MKTSEIIAQFRDMMDDVAAPYLYANTIILRYLNNGENEAARRARLLVDSTTPELTRYTIKAGREWLTLDKRVIFVKRFMITNQTEPVRRAHRDDMDRNVPGWESHTGSVIGYIPNMETGKLRLYRDPDADYAASLTVVREPLKPMTADENCEPEIASRYHDKLVHWMLHEGYLKRDCDAYNPERAADHLALFESEFGKRSSAVDETWIREQGDFFIDEGIY